MVRLLKRELQTYDRECARLENEHRGKFVLIRGEEVAAIFEDFQTASEHAARRFKQEPYLIHRIGTEMAGAFMLLDRLAAIYAHARECKQQPGMCRANARSPHRPHEAMRRCTRSASTHADLAEH
jgi:hypothetical protein